MCFPREDVRIVRVDELCDLYAMVNRIKFSPVKFMVRQRLKNFRLVVLTPFFGTCQRIGKRENVRLEIMMVHGR